MPPGGLTTGRCTASRAHQKAETRCTTPFRRISPARYPAHTQWRMTTAPAVPTLCITPMECAFGNPKSANSKRMRRFIWGTSIRSARFACEAVCFLTGSLANQPDSTCPTPGTTRGKGMITEGRERCLEWQDHLSARALALCSQRRARLPDRLAPLPA